MIDINEKFIKLIELIDTWQGEGINIGKSMLLARFKYCDRKCNFCDTWIKMKSAFEGCYSISDINKNLEKTNAIMISGGEPTFNSKFNNNLDQTIDMLVNCNFEVANVETNGFALKELIDRLYKSENLPWQQKRINIIYSPKIFCEKEYLLEYNKTVELITVPIIYFKVVADKNPWSEKYIKDVATLLNNREKPWHSKSKLYLMPLGITVDEISKNWEYCINLADEVDANISTRMHIMHQFT